MKVIVAFILGIIIGAGGLWYYSTHQGRAGAPLGDQIQSSAESARAAIEDKLRNLHLGTNDIQDELARTGQVMRQKARDAGQAIADATADARITAAIKAKLVASSDLSGWSISVSTTSGIVTLSGAVPTMEAISRAMMVALETDGVRQVISTMQVKTGR